MSEPELVDRVALALFNHDMSSVRSYIWHTLKNWPEEDKGPGRSREIYRAKAVAAITELCRRVEPDKPDIAQDK